MDSHMLNKSREVQQLCITFDWLLKANLCFSPSGITSLSFSIQSWITFLNPKGGLAFSQKLFFFFLWQHRKIFCLVLHLKALCTQWCHIKCVLYGFNIHTKHKQSWNSSVIYRKTIGKYWTLYIGIVTIKVKAYIYGELLLRSQVSCHGCRVGVSCWFFRNPALSEVDYLDQVCMKTCRTPALDFNNTRFKLSYYNVTKQCWWNQRPHWTVLTQ